MTKKPATKKEKTYALMNGNKTVYIGKTEDMDRRIEEHKAEGKVFTRAKVTSRSISEATALAREAEQLEKYRKTHKGKNPQYNKTDHG